MDRKACPICGAQVYVAGVTTDGRLIGSCRDAFTQAQWDADDDEEVDLAQMVAMRAKLDEQAAIDRLDAYTRDQQ